MLPNNLPPNSTGLQKELNALALFIPPPPPVSPEASLSAPSPLAFWPKHHSIFQSALPAHPPSKTPWPPLRHALVGERDGERWCS